MRTLPLFLFLIPALVRAEGLAFSTTAAELDIPAGALRASAKFAFKNSTGKTLKIVRTESECSCMTITTAENKTTFTPGEAGELTGTFEVGAYTGTIDKTIRVWLEGDTAPSATLKVRAHIPELVSIDIKTLKWDLGGARGSPRKVVVRFPKDAPAKITSATSSDPRFVPTVHATEEGHAYEIEVACSDTSAKALGIIRLSIDSEMLQQQRGQFYAFVK